LFLFTPYEKEMKVLIDLLSWEHLLLIVSQVHQIIVLKKSVDTETKRHKRKSYFYRDWKEK
jgi:hypothetical protein